MKTVGARSPATMPSKTKALTYSVEVIDKTGKAIHTSRTVLGALKEARDAYKAKRAERKAERDAEKAARLALKQRAYEEQLREARRARREARRASEDTTRDDDRRRERRERQERRLTEGNIGDNGSETSSIYSSAMNRSSGQLTLRSTTDLSLPPLPPPPEVNEEEDHVTALFLQVQDIIDHAAAAQSSVITLIDALRREPETLAMLGLTLAEISTVVAKMSPSILGGLKLSWPAVFAVLASPQFAIIAGVGIGTTVVLIGGYKIIKKMMGGEPAKPPEIVDMGGKVVDETDVRAITEAVEEVRISEPARERERERHHKSRKAIEDDPMAFGGKQLRRRHTHHDRESDAESSYGGSRRSIEDVSRPVPRRSRTMGASKPEQPDVPPLAFDVAGDSKSKSRLRSHGSSSRSKSSRSDSGDDAKRSHKREKNLIKDLEEGGKYMVVRRR